MIKKTKPNVEKNDSNINSIKEISVEDIIPNCIEDVVIYKENNKAALYVTTNMAGEILRHWKKGRGGIVLNDFKTNKDSTYFLLNKDGEREIIRIINEIELPQFEILNLVDGVFDTKNYMFVKKLNNADESINQVRRYIEETGR